MFDNCLTSQCTGESLKVLTKIKKKVFANVWLLTAPSPPAPSAYTAQVSRSNRPPLTTIAHPTQTQSSPTFLFENLQINPFHSNLDVWDHTATHLYLQWIAIWQIFLFSFFFFSFFLCCCCWFCWLLFGADFFVYCLASADYRWELKPALSYQQSRLQSRLIHIFRFFSQYFFFPGTFTGG